MDARVRLSLPAERLPLLNLARELQAAWLGRAGWRVLRLCLAQRARQTPLRMTELCWISRFECGYTWGLVDRAGLGDDEAGFAGLGVFEGDGAEGLLVLDEVVGEDAVQSLGLLGAEVNALEVVDLDFLGGLLLELAEDEHEVPDGEADLDAVGVGVAVVWGFVEGDAGVVGLSDGLAHRVLWCVVREEGLEPSRRSTGF